MKQNMAVNIYLSQMNRISKRLQMLNSRFSNPHGLSNPDNYSCAEDLCKLCTFCMEN
jgi:D-alanyl-D-alanine carboxypeptidase